MTVILLEYCLIFINIAFHDTRRLVRKIKKIFITFSYMSEDQMTDWCLIYVVKNKNT